MTFGPNAAYVDSGQKSGEIEGQVTVGTTTADTYTIRLSVIDSKGLHSNELTGSFRVSDFPWVAKQSMPVPRDEFATAVIDGRIYVLGGNVQTFAGWPKPPVNRVDVYDPALDIWTQRSDLPWPPLSKAGTTVIDGRVYVAGGHNWEPALESMFAYDIVADLWSGKTAMLMVTSSPTTGTWVPALYSLRWMRCEPRSQSDHPGTSTLDVHGSDGTVDSNHS